MSREDRSSQGLPEQRSTQPEVIDWLAPHRLALLAKLCGNVEAPWSLFPSAQTIPGTIILHDANGVAIADLYTVGPATDVDRLIALAPTAIAQLVAEVLRLQRAARESRFSAGEWICIRCGRTPVQTFGGYCIDCDAQQPDDEPRP